MVKTVLDDVVRILQDVLRLEPRTHRMDQSTLLLGAVPELDSVAVVSVVTALEEHFGFVFDDDEIQGSSFESVGDLTALVESKL